MSTVGGEPTYVLHDFMTSLINLHQKLPGHRILVAFDRPEQTAPLCALEFFLKTSSP